MNYESLDPRQRANVAGLQIKREAIRRKYGNAVQILTTDEEAANQSGWMALPLKEINTSKQVTFRMNKEAVDTKTASRLSTTSRDSIPDTEGVVDIVTALEQTAGIASPTKVNKPVEAPKAPKAPTRSLSGLSDAEFIQSLLNR